MPAIIGKKLGMTQVFTEDGSSVPVTVIEAGPCKVTALRNAERDGYDAVQLAFGEVAERKLTKAELGHLAKAGAPPSRTWSSSATPDAPALRGRAARTRRAERRRAEGRRRSRCPGDKVKVSGTSIGKGFQGTIKRHNFSRGPVSHGSHNVRAPGSVGASADPARVFKGQKMPGQTGGDRVTQRGLEVVEVDAERNLLLIKGAVPGSRNATVEVRSNG